MANKKQKLSFLISPTLLLLLLPLLLPLLLTLFDIRHHLVAGSYKDDSSNLHAQSSDNRKQVDAIESGGNFAYSTAPTDEAKIRLAFLFDEKMDSNKDGLLQLDELVRWLKESRDRYIRVDAIRHWETFRGDIDYFGTLGWEDYIKQQYGHLKTLIQNAEQTDPEHAAKIRDSYDYHLKRDLRRWKAADQNQDNRLTESEFNLFLHPESFESMHQLLIDERLETLDEDRDGKLSADEFLRGLQPNAAQPNYDAQEDWLRGERTKFENDLDKDGDKFMDRSELASWVKKSLLDDQSISEAQQLMQVADSNRDHRLTKEEVLAAYHEFIASHATDFGEAIRNPVSHDEL